MEVYLLIMYTEYETEEIAMNFCTEIFPHEKLKNTKFIVESPKNIIIRFETEKDSKELSKELYETLNIKEINVYFLIRLRDLVAVYLPIQLKAFLYDEVESEGGNILTPKRKVIEREYFSVDNLLAKIKKEGINSLTKSEKKFLDNFNK